MARPASSQASVGELLTASFAILSQGWARALAISMGAMLGAFVIALVGLSVLEAVVGFETPGRAVSVTIIAPLAGLGILLASFGPIVRSLLEANGQAPRSHGARDDVAAALGALVQGLVLVFAVAGPGLILFTALEIDDEERFAALALLCLLVASILTARFLAGVPAMLVERLGPIDALRRSHELVRGRTAHVWGLLFLIGVVDRIVAGVGDSLLAPSDGMDLFGALAVIYLSFFASTAALTPLYAAGAIAVYADRVAAGRGPLGQPGVAHPQAKPQLAPVGRRPSGHLGAPPSGRPTPWESAPPL